MKDGSVLLVKGDPNEKGIMGFLGRVIMWRTKSDKTHVYKYSRGQYFDDTIYLVWKWGFIPILKSGVRVSDTVPLTGIEVRDLKTPLTESESWGLNYWCNWYAKQEYHYNIFQLITFLVIYPTRWIWNKLGIVPFESAIDFVCSTFAAMADEVIGREVIPLLDPTLVVPGDYDKSPFYEGVR